VQVTRRRSSATLTLTPFEPLPAQAVTELTEEAERLLGFAEPDAAELDVLAHPAG
jgi:hypothetical protein